ncbi:IS5/IS1182 family transposase [Amycolatopsis sp. FBCC-B4732]|uniref:transposase family protein n=1 Tax=Amycolatopsis sp. FBCC-B4732 TaxID=3079339 RepID=UPI001FF160C4|nr:transposase family protein [Amycolatopsis sp. FBCC-B4732]UOX88491.1 IS5/IS1182 family transposase [Amycolatopsis sp. FBCC-B4732]UOX90842.1 IS5/IS1182 family transposase [Amycolatopsis sp. FBCC-B4732]
MINYGATLDVSGDLVWFVAGVLRAERLRRGTRRGRRALTPYRHAVLVLRWFRDAIPVHRLATDHRISIATAYRYLHEAITALAAQAPDLHQVLAQRRDTGDTHVVLDGSLFTCDRVAATTTKTKGRNRGATVHLWYSGKHRTFGGNIQFLASPGGFPLWTSPVLPGSRNDLSAARDLGIAGALTAAAAVGLPTLADKAYHSAGIGIHTPFKKAAGQPPLGTRQRVHNLLHSRLRALGERAMAILKTRWRALQHISLCPHRIGAIVQAALVLTHHEHHGRY